MEILDLNKINDYKVSDLINNKNINNINYNIFKDIDNKKNIDKKIQYIVTYPRYILIIIGIISCILFLTFIAMYVKQKQDNFNILIPAIIFCLIFFIGYFASLFYYSIYIKKLFKSLKYKFNSLIKQKILIDNYDKYPDILLMIQYDKRPIEWSNLNKKIPRFSYYGSVIGLIIFFNKLQEYLKTYEQN